MTSLERTCTRCYPLSAMLVWQLLLAAGCSPQSGTAPREFKADVVQQLPRTTFTSTSGPSTQGSNWQQFRGPSGQGHADDADLPTTWGPEENIVWRKEIAGTGWSSPVVAEDRIYLTTAVPQGDGPKANQSLRAICLEADSADIVWDVEVFPQDGEQAPRIHQKNSHASPTPVVSGDDLFVHFGHMGTARLKTVDGSIVWSTQKLAYKPTHGNGGSPVLSGQNLIFSIDGNDRQAVVALDIKTGEVAWETPRNMDVRKYFSFCTPLLIDVEGQSQLISPGSGVVMAVEPDTGREIWRVRYGEGYSVVPRPIVSGGLVYVCTGYDKPGLLAIRPDGEGDVTDTHVAYRVDRNVPHNPSLVAVEDAIYMVSDSGILSCIDAMTGDLRWKERIGGNFSASPLHAGDLIYLLNEEGKTTVFRHGDRYQNIAENDLHERSLASMGVVDDDLLLRTEKALYRIGKR